MSTLANEAPPTVITDIANKACRFNEANGITGLLEFDGMRFCQQLEGSPKQVLTLLERICEDPRHTHLEVVHHGQLAQWRLRNFSRAYTTTDDETALAELEKLDALDAVDAFVALLGTLDLAP